MNIKFTAFFSRINWIKGFMYNIIIRSSIIIILYILKKKNNKNKIVWNEKMWNLLDENYNSMKCENNLKYVYIYMYLKIHDNMVSRLSDVNN